MMYNNIFKRSSFCAACNVIKFSLLSAVLFFCMAFLYSEESAGNSQTYTQNKDSIFLVNQSIFLDSSIVGNKELFVKLEQAMDIKVLDQYIPVSNGTAFLINQEGYLITAFHVIKYLDAEEQNEGATWSFLEFIGKHIIPGYLTKQEIHLVCNEYTKVVKRSQIVVSLKSTKKTDYLAEIVAQNDSLDLALLKIKLNEQIKSLVIYDGKELKVGDPVLTIGYPLTFIMDSFLDDFKPTLTNGIVSALRTDKWDIQHTASLNGGNSGGPLLTQDGKVVGVNVGTLTDANNIYFSTNANKLINWLKEIGKSDLLKAN
jgi:S1-C subfamily serine protease